MNVFQSFRIWAWRSRHPHPIALCSYTKKLPSKHTEVFDKEIQPHEMVKYLCESVVVL